MAETPAAKAKDFSVRSLGSGAFIISKPKRSKIKMRVHRLKNRRRAR